MIRNLLTIGAIAGFIASAFVSPTNANFSTIHAMAQDEVRTRTAGSLFGGNALSAKDAAAAAKVLTAVATNPALKSAASKALGGAASLKNIDDAATVLTSVSAPKTVLKHVAKTAKKMFTVRKLTHVWKTYKVSADPFTLAQIDRIEWALKKNDVRLCSGTAEAAANRSDQAPQTLSPGEYLALCVAIVTGDEGRCDQILPTSDSSMHSLCTEELATI